MYMGFAMFIGTMSSGATSRRSWPFSGATTVALLTVVFGGFLVAALVDVVDWADHPARRRQRAAERAAQPRLTQSELAAEAAYEDQFRAEEREQKRRPKEEPA
jgi:hypothetical protein